MSRHRIVRTMDYKDEYDGYDDVYGHSVDDDSCISPTDASQWIYDRAKGQQSISAFMANNQNIEEEQEGEEDDDNEIKKRRDSENYQMPILDEIEQAKLVSCIDEIRNVVGDAISEKQIVETAMKYNYDVAKTLDFILNTTSTPQEINSTAKYLKNVSISNEKDYENKSNSQISKLNQLIQNNLKFSDKTGLVLPQTNINASYFSQIDTTKSSSKLNNFIVNKINQSEIHLKNKDSSNISSKNDVFELPNLNTLSVTNKSSLNNSFINSYENITKNKNEVLFENIKLQIKNNSNGKEQVNVDDEKGSIIDLSNVVSFKKKINTNKIENNFFLRFVDCELITPKLKLRKNKIVQCKIETKKRKLKFFGKPSYFAKILSLKYICENMPNIEHSFNYSNSDVKHFNFDTESPDDLRSLWKKNLKR